VKCLKALEKIMTTDVFDLLGTPEATRLMRVAVERAADKARSLGLPKPVQIRGEWLSQYPDGRLETIVRPGTTPEQRGTVDNPLPAQHDVLKNPAD
jgi:hypothetical protein